MKILFIASLLIFSYGLQAMEQQGESEEAQKRKLTRTEALSTLRTRAASMAPGWGKKLTEDAYGTVSREIIDSLKLDPDFKPIMELVKNNDSGELGKKVDQLNTKTEDEKLYLIHLAAEHKAFDALLTLLNLFPQLSLKNYKRLYPCPKVVRSVNENCTLLGLAIVNRKENLALALKRHGIARTDDDRKIADIMDKVGDTYAEQQISGNISDLLFGAYRVSQN